MGRPGQTTPCPPMSRSNTRPFPATVNTWHARRRRCSTAPNSAGGRRLGRAAGERFWEPCPAPTFKPPGSRGFHGRAVASNLTAPTICHANIRIQALKVMGLGGRGAERRARSLPDSGSGSVCHCEAPRKCSARKQSIWIATARSAGLAMTRQIDPLPKLRVQHSPGYAANRREPRVLRPPGLGGPPLDQAGGASGALEIPLTIISIYWLMWK